MAGFLLVSIMLLLVHNTLSKVASNVDSTGANDAFPNTLGERANEDSKCVFDELDDDVLFLVFERFDIIELISVAANNGSRINSIARDAFQYKYKDYRIDLDIDSIDCDKYDDEIYRMYYLNDAAASLTLKDCKLTKEFFKYFGDLIHSIELDVFNKKQNSVINLEKLVNDYSAESVMSLTLGNIRNNTFGRFVAPFKNLTKLSFAIDVDQIGEVLPFNQIFPKIEKLIMTLKADLNYSFLECEMPTLDDVVFDGNAVLSNSNSQIENLFRKNEQIRSFSINENIPTNYARVINELMPRIENLYMAKLVITGETVRFGNVKNFKLYDQYPSITKILMPRLESVELFYSQGNDLVEFFKNHKTLTKLYLQLQYESRDDFPLWEELVAEIPNLVELKFDKNYESVVNIAKIVEDHGKLKKFEFWTGKYDEKDFEELKKRFETEWNITNSDRKEFTVMDKKN